MIVAAVAACIAPGVAVGAQRAAQSRILVPLSGASPVGAGSGWSVWSESPRGTAGARLVMRRADGRLSRPPLAPRRSTWDADVIERSPGRPWLVFSRCSQEQPSRPPTPRSEYSSGCRLVLYDAVRHREQVLPVDPSSSTLMPTFATRNTVVFLQRFADHQVIARMDVRSGVAIPLVVVPDGVDVTGLDARGGTIAYSLLQAQPPGSALQSIWSREPGGEPRQLAEFVDPGSGIPVGYSIFGPAVTPRGIAYIYSAASNDVGFPSFGRLMLVRLAGASRLLHDQHAEIDGVAWDGRRLVYVSSGPLCPASRETACSLLALSLPR